ncbi:centromere protein N isoform X2 [Lampetra fluviatilis]
MEPWVLLRHAMYRLRQAECLSVLEAWGVFSGSQMQALGRVTRGGKGNFISAAVRFCKEKNVELKKVAELSLLSLQKTPNKKQWTVFQLLNPQEADKCFDAGDLEYELQENISAYFENVVAVIVREDAVWIQVILMEGARSTVSMGQMANIVFYPQCHHMFIADLKASYNDYIIQGYRPNKLAQETSVQEKVAPLDPRSCDENLREKQRTMALTRQAFGDAPQPMLESLSYAMDTRFRGYKVVPQMEGHTEHFRMKVKLESKNVLEAVKSLAPLGLAAAPLPGLLTMVPQRGRNFFKVMERQGANSFMVSTTGNSVENTPQ